MANEMVHLPTLPAVKAICDFPCVVRLVRHLLCDLLSPDVSMSTSHAIKTEGAPIAKPQPFGWFCELVHDKTGEVVNTNFFRDAPIEGPHRVKGFTWRATPLYA